MINLENLRLSHLAPKVLNNDRETAALMQALDRQLQEITAAIETVIIMPAIDRLPEDVVDLLAWQLHVDFYEPLGLDLTTKRALVKNSLIWHRRKGTKSVVEEIIQTLCYEDSYIEEWFEYGGEPYYFRIRVAANENLNESDIRYMVAAANSLKNVRSWLEGLRVETKVPPATLYLNGYVTQTSRITMPVKYLSDKKLKNVLGYLSYPVSASEKHTLSTKTLNDKEYIITMGIGAVLGKKEATSISLRAMEGGAVRHQQVYGVYGGRIERISIPTKEVME